MKKRFIIAVVVSLVLFLLAVMVWMRQASDVNSVLSRVGFVRLPESARDVMVDSQGSMFDMRVTLVRFEAAHDDMRRFVERSSIADREQRGVMDIRLNAVVYPSWWPQRGEPFGQKTYYTTSNRSGGLATVDYETNTICIQLMHHSPLLRRIKRYIPFI